MQDEEQSDAVSQGKLQFWDVVMVRKVKRRIRIRKFMFFCKSFVVKRLHNEVLF